MNSCQQTSLIEEKSFKNIFALILFLGIIVLFYTTYKVDYNAYYTASKAFLNGENPYSKSTLLIYQQKINPTVVTPMMVWNPPMFFSTFGIVLFLPEHLKLTFWLIASILSAIGLAVAGFYWKDPDNFNFHKLEFDKIAVCAFCCIPFIAQTIIGQFSSWIYFVFILGLLAFDKKKDFIAGILMSFSLVKPHLFLLVYLAFGYEVLKERRFKVVIGGIIGILFFSLISELRYPGIHNLWLYREQWPVEYLGATFPSLVSKMLFGSTRIKALQIASLSLGILSIFVFRIYTKNYNFRNFFIFALISNSIFSPYGFVFDQSCLIFVITYILAVSPQRGLRIDVYNKILFFFLLHFILFIVGSRMNYDWYVLPLFMMWLFKNMLQVIPNKINML